jgi:hypothetical protein
VLQSIDRSKLADSDVELLDAAIAVAGEVRRPLLTSDPPLSLSAGPESPLPKAVEVARKVMARVDMLLNEVSK